MISDELWINNVNSRFEIHFLSVFWPPRTKQWKPLLWQRPVWTKSLQLALAIRPAQRAWPSVTGRNQSQSSKWVRRAEVRNRLFAIGGVKMTKVGTWSSIDSFSWCLALRPQVPSVFWKLGVRHQVCCWPWYTTPCKMLQLPTKAADWVWSKQFYRFYRQIQTGERFFKTLQTVSAPAFFFARSC